VSLDGEGRETVGLHDLRHSFVAIALANGVTLPEAAMLARHANPKGDPGDLRRPRRWRS
jgi:integrase